MRAARGLPPASEEAGTLSSLDVLTELRLAHAGHEDRQLGLDDLEDGH
jgi:hypothetical protein